MKKHKTLLQDSTLLRMKAEEKLKNKASETTPLLSKAELLKLIHELDVQQVELELQNEELKSVISIAKDASDLYDFAPTGYFSLTRNSEILKLNLSGSKILGHKQSYFTNVKLSSFVSNESKPIFNFFLDRVFASNGNESCEVALSVNNGLPIFVHLNGIARDGREQCLITATDITVRKQAEEALLESKERYRFMFTNNPQPMWIFDIETLAFLEVNEAAVCHYGYSAEEFLSMSLKDISPAEDIPASLESAEQNDLTFKQEGELRHVKKNGEIIIVLITWHSVIFNGLKARHVLVNDITKRKQAEMALQESEANLSAILNATDESVILISPDATVIALNETTAKRNGSIIGNLIGQKVHNLLTPKVVENWHLYIERVTQTGEPALFQDQSNGRWLRNHIYPILDVSGKVSRMAIFSRDITEQKLTQDALNESEARFHRLYESASLGIFQTNRDGKIISVNPSFARIFGYNTPDELINSVKDVAAELFVHPDRRDEIIGLLEIKPELNSFENTCRRKDGSTFIGWLNVTRINDGEGQFEHMEGVIEDITQRKQTDEALLNSKLQYDKLTDNIPVGVYVLHSKADGSFLLDYVSTRMAEMMGVSVESLLTDARLVYETIYPDDRAGFAELNEEGIRLKQPFNWIGRVFVEGKIKWMHINSSPELLGNGDILWHGITVDITKEKLAEDEINEAHNRLLKIASRVPGLVYQFKLHPDGTSCFPYASDGIEKIFRVSPDEVREDASKIFEKIHPDDFDSMLTSIHTSAKDLSPWKHEFRVKLAEGIIRTLLGNAMPQLETDGSVLWHGFITDVTELKQAEQALKESEIRFKNIFERNNAIMLLVEPVSGQIMDANKAAADFYGYSLQQLRAMNIDEINELPGNEVKVVRQKALQEKKNYFIFNHKLANDEKRIVEIYSSPIEFPDKPVLFSIIHDITERKKAEEKLHESEKRYRQLVETANEAILVAQGDTFKFVNSMACALTGYTEKELVSTPFIEFVHPDDRTLVIDNYIKRLKEEIFDQNYNFRFIAKGNNLRWVEMTGVKIDWEGQPATLNFASDITTRKKAEEALIESERHANALIGAIPDLIFIMNRQGIFLDYKADIKDLSYQKELIIGKHIHEIMPASFAGLIDKKIQLTLQNRDIQKFEYELEIPERGLIDFEARMLPYGTDEIVAIVRDVTERKKAEEEIKLKNKDLIKANAEKDKFFSIIAHDLRGPIGGFMGLTEKMAESMSEMTLDELQNIARVMKNSSSNIYSLLGNLLEWSRMQRGLTTFEPVSFILMSKIHDIMLITLDSATKKEISVNYTIPGNLEVFADENMLASIIRNLVANAVKFTQQGGNISISAAAADKFVEISVSDNGIGMNKNIIENLFNLDVNTNRKGTDGELSTGLGLMICKDFIEMHGSVLNVESEAGKGSTFSFMLPCSS